MGGQYVAVAHDRAGGPIKLFYRLAGSGKDNLLLINGMGGILSQWDDQVHFFTGHGFTVLAFDNRGSGKSCSPDVYYSTTEMALDVLELLNYLQWDKFHVIGLSMGGMIAQELFWLLKDRVKSLVLESTYSRFPGLPWTAVKNIVLAKQSINVEEFSERVVTLLFPKNWLNAPCDPKRGTFKDNYELCLDYFCTRYSQVGLQDPKGRFRQQVACLTHHLSDKRLEILSKLNIPTLILTGDIDHVTLQPLGCQTLAQGLNAELKVYQGGGHALRYQDPDWHNTHCLDHLLRAIKDNS